jgi:hypothetical protein
MRGLIVLSMLLLAGCGAAPEERRVETDPAVADALADPVMADPQLVLQHGGGSPTGVPLGGIPDMPDDMPTPGELARTWVKDAAFIGCDAKIAYAYAWMARLPAGLSLPVAAQVTEAGGSESPNCAFRVVRYGIVQLPPDVAAAWRSAGTGAGYTLSGDDKALRGFRKRDAAAFVLTVQPSKTGSSVDLVTKSRP